MKLWTLLVFFISLNASGYVIANLVTAGVLVGNTAVMPYSMNDITVAFDPVKVFSAAAGIGIAGLFGLITRQGIYAITAALIWVVGIFLNVVSWMLWGFPLMLNVLLAGTGLEVIVPAVVGAFLPAFFFFSLAGILSQREFT
jgi:hypothetical protein